jgi:1-acyl-sn-glycerol-3-phosphate acyltransferase
MRVAHTTPVRRPASVVQLPVPRRPPVEDPFGYSPAFYDQVRPLGEFLFRRYWRVQAENVAQVPISGPVLIVSNHSGGIPIDAAMMAMAIELEHAQPRRLRFLYDRFVSGMPLVGEFYNRVGAVPASYDNARALLQRGEAVGIFPEGVEGMAKGVGRRYRVQSFRPGFMRLSLELGVPIVPVAVVGAEESYPVIGKWKAGGLFTKWLNVPYIPVTPFFPLLGVLGMIPLPTRWYMRFGEPLHPYRDVDPARATRRTVNKLADGVRRHIQGMIHALLAERPSVF